MSTITSKFLAFTCFLFITLNTLSIRASVKYTLLESEQTDEPTAPIEDFELHINCGGDRIVAQGVTFEADQYYLGDSKKYENKRIRDIKKTNDDALYLSERSVTGGSESFGYKMDVPNGVYEVKLHFAEIYWGATGGNAGGVGKRNFSVALENQWLLSNYDIAADVGSMTAVIKTFTVAVADGKFNLDLYGNVDQPKLSAFELVYKGSTSTQQSEAYDWKELALSPTRKIEPQSIQIDNKLFMFCGFTNGYKMVKATEIYDPKTNSWSTGTAMPLPVTHGATAVIDGEVWIIGGFFGDNPGKGTNMVQIYNVSKDTWREGPALPKVRAAGAAAYYKGKLHFFGGFYPDRQSNSGDHFVLDLAKVDQGWQNDTPMPNPRGHLSAALVNGIIYAIGGQHGHDGKIVDQNSVQAYDPKSKQWTEKQALPYRRSHFEPGTFVYDDQIIIVGGRRGPTYFYDRVTAYDPATDVWREIGKLPTVIVGPSAKIFNGQLVISNGGVNGDFNFSAQTWSTPFELSTPNLSVENVENTPRFTEVYPNPVDRILFLKLNGNAENMPINIEFTTLLGQSVRQNSIENVNPMTEQLIDVSDLQNGIYFVTITQGKNKNSFKIIKN